jgi:hypothetical protein
VARRAQAGEDVYASVREFLDSFYALRCRERAARRAMLAEAPVLLGDAWLAAVAEHLPALPPAGAVLAAWPRRFLHQAHFGGPEGMKAMLLAESPLAFRRRMIFVDYDPLRRPSRRGRRPQPPPWGEVPPAAGESKAHMKL